MLEAIALNRSLSIYKDLAAPFAGPRCPTTVSYVYRLELLFIEMIWMVVVWLSLVVITGFLIPLVALFWYLQDRDIRFSNIPGCFCPCWSRRRGGRDIESMESYHRPRRRVKEAPRSPKRSQDANKRRAERAPASERTVHNTETTKRLRTTMRNTTRHQRGDAAGNIAANNLREEVHAKFRAPLAPAAARHALRSDVQRRGSVHSPRGTVHSQRATVHRQPTVESDEEWDSEQFRKGSLLAETRQVAALRKPITNSCTYGRF